MSTHQSGHIYRSAKSFYALALPAFNDNKILAANVMAVVANLALCVELLLKSTDAKVVKSQQVKNGPLSNAEIKSNVRVRGHDLRSIFDALDSSIQAILIQKFEEETHQSLLPLLDKCKDYFIHARYSYELKSSHSYDISAIKLLADGLDAAIINSFG